MSEQRYPHLRRNAVFFGLDFICFGVGMALLNPNTVLPTLTRRLTDSMILVGLVSTLSTGGWMLPQIFAANLVAGRPRMKPFILWPALLGRLALLAAAVVILVFGGTSGSLTLTIFFPCWLLLWISDGIASVPWFDMMAKAIPPTRFGRLFGTSQIVVGFAAVGIGWLVTYLIGPHSPTAFPLNYALLFFGATVSLFGSFTSVALIREPVGQTSRQKSPWREYVPKLWAILRTDPVVIRLISGRLLVGFSAMAFSFYILFATEKLALGPAVVGPFTAAQTIGGMLAGLVLGYLHERLGSVAVIRVSVAGSLAIPLVALLVHLASGVLGSALPYVYGVIFLLIGVVNGSFMLGFLSCLLESAPPTERAIYVGLANTFNSLIIAAPLIGGWILRAGTYPLLFVISAVCALLAFVPVRTLAEPRTRNMQESRA